MQNELTKEQVERQDFVDNEIYSLIGSLVPPEYMPERGDWAEVFPPNADAIGKVRDIIQQIIREALDIKPDDEAFEMAFYPFVVEEPEPIIVEPQVAVIIKTERHYKLFWDCKLPSEILRKLNPQLREAGFIAGYPIGANRLFCNDLSESSLRKAEKILKTFGFEIENREKEDE